MTANPKSKVQNPKSNVSNATWLALAAALAVVGWSGLYYIVVHIHPTAVAQALFLMLLGIALLGTTWPALLAINQHWDEHASPMRVWRQSGWAATFGMLAAWLQMRPNRALTLPLAVTIAGIFALIELMLILREREATKHEEPQDDNIKKEDKKARRRG